MSGFGDDLAAGGTFRGELTQVEGRREDLDRRQFKRINLEAPAALVVAGALHEGPCDVSRWGIGIVAPVAVDVGSTAVVQLPPAGDNEDVAQFAGKVVRCDLVIAPRTSGDTRCVTLHCFDCGWSGYFDPDSRELHSALTDTSASVAERPERCPTCERATLSVIDRPYYSVGLDLSAQSPRDGARLWHYIEVVLRRRAELGRRKHRRFLLDYIPAKVRCTIKDPKTLTAVFLEDISQGGIGFSSPEAFKLGDEVRVVLATAADREDFVLPAKIVSSAVQEGGLRYGARFINFDDATRAELLAFINAATGNAIDMQQQRSEPTPHVSRMARNLVIGILIGLLAGFVVAMLVFLRNR